MKRSEFSALKEGAKVWVSSLWMDMDEGEFIEALRSG